MYGVFFAFERSYKNHTHSTHLTIVSACSPMNRSSPWKDTTDLHSYASQYYLRCPSLRIIVQDNINTSAANAGSHSTSLTDNACIASKVNSNNRHLAEFNNKNKND